MTLWMMVHVIKILKDLSRNLSTLNTSMNWVSRKNREGER